VNAVRLVPLLLATACLVAADPAPPTPHAFTVRAGEAFSFTPNFRGGGITFSSEGLPAGMHQDPVLGTISGRPEKPGTYAITIIAKNTLGSATSRVALLVTGTPTTTAAAVAKPHAPPPPPPPAAEDEEEDEVDPMLSSGTPLAAWTDNQRRVIHHWFLPGAATLPDGDWYYRISHVARKGYEEEPRTNLMGLDDDVKIGFMVAWAPLKAVTLSLQRINGRDLAVPTHEGKAVQYDTYDMLAQVQLLDQRGVRGMWDGPCDLSVVAGSSWMLRNYGTGDASLDLGVVAERDLFNDRLRLGLGLWRAGLSAYDAAVGGIGPVDKAFPDENGAAAQNGTTAIGMTARFALGEHWFLLGEAVQPIAGWKTERGPSLAAGLAYDTNTHEFAIYFSNTANAAFNSVLTGGAQEMALPFFAFSITAYL
jgi:hypothetical protein